MPKGIKGFQKGHFNYGGYRFSKGNIPWNKKVIRKDWLYQKYIVEKLSAHKIANLCSCCGNTVLNKLKEYGIITRTISEAHQGKTLTEIHKKKISSSILGHKVSQNTRKKIGDANRGNHGYMLGKHHTEETKKKISNAQKGERGHQWIDGRTPENTTIRRSVEYKIWREKVFEKDDWTCQKCKIRGWILHPHHIYNFSKYKELRFEVSNGITFCKKCHNRFHKTYSIKDNNQKQIEKFLRN